MIKSQNPLSSKRGVENTDEVNDMNLGGRRILISLLIIGGLAVIIGGLNGSFSQEKSLAVTEDAISTATPGSLGPPSELVEARYYEKLPEDWVRCALCPRRCALGEGQRGICGVRINQEGTLRTLVYGNPCAVHVDPIEKKPLSHVLPGSKSFSIATAGCNLRCIHCQNWQISQAKPEQTTHYDLPPQRVVEEAKKSGCKSIAYTYTEPTVFYEYMLETAKIAHQEGIRNIWVTCGYINPEPLRELCGYLDAANVDLKGFTDEFYQKIGGAELKPVLETMKILKEEGVWFEITNLIIPTLNDDPNDIRRMCEWVKENLGTEVPLYFSRFYPAHTLTNLPPTPVGTLEEAQRIAQETGLQYVYIGNVPGHPGEHTYCPQCKKVLVRRIGYFIAANNIREGKCQSCGHRIPGIWE